MPEQPAPEPALEPALATDPAADSGGFTVRLTNFTGPFDLLLQLIGKHKLDVTEIALHTVTDDFIAYIRAMGDDWDLGETSEFLLVAATLLDLKAARLLPSAEVEDEDDLALLEAGDLLFARLLQYKAYKEAAAVIADLEGIGTRRWPRAVTLEPRYAEALPDLVLGIGPERLLKLALKQFLPKPGPPEVSIAHIHQVRVSVREHAALIRDRLRRAGSATFSLLIADCENTLEVVARFLALLELYREGLVDFEQPVSLEEMTVRWIGGDHIEGDLDIDDYEGTPPEVDTAAMDLDEIDDSPGPSAAATRAEDDEEEDDDADLDAFDIPDIDEGLPTPTADLDDPDDVDDPDDPDPSDPDDPDPSGPASADFSSGSVPDGDPHDLADLDGPADAVAGDMEDPDGPGGEVADGDLADQGNPDGSAGAVAEGDLAVTEDVDGAVGSVFDGVSDSFDGSNGDGSRPDLADAGPRAEGTADADAEPAGTGPDDPEPIDREASVAVDPGNPAGVHRTTERVSTDEELS